MATDRRCFLHIGLPKTGTSYLQSILWHSRPALLEQGLAMLPDTKVDTLHLMLALRGQLRETMDPPEAFTALDRFRSAAATSTAGRALVTQELLAFSTDSQITTLLDALGDHEVHVVITVRDLARLIPSVWQQSIKARGTMPYEQFLHSLLADETPSRTLQRHDIVGVLDRWSAHVPAERTHVVTVPKSGAPTVLLERFCSVLGVDPSSLDVDSHRENPSLGLVQTELLRRVNLALGNRLPHLRAGYRQQGREFLGKRVLAPQGGEPPRMPRRLAGWCHEKSREVVDRLRVDGYDIVGDLDDLVPDDSFFSETDQPVSDAQVAEAAVAALASILDVRSAEAEVSGRPKRPRRRGGPTGNRMPARRRRPSLRRRLRAALGGRRTG